jgi:hypothetical protein
LKLFRVPSFVHFTTLSVLLIQQRQYIMINSKRFGWDLEGREMKLVALLLDGKMVRIKVLPLT